MDIQLNIISKKPYTGGNHKLLRNQYKSNKWGTFLQWKSIGFNINKGEKGTLCFRPLVKMITDDEGNKIQKNIRKYFTLFNKEQVTREIN